MNSIAKMKSLTDIFSADARSYKISNKIGSFDIMFANTYIEANVIREKKPFDELGMLSKATITYNIFTNEHFKCIFDNIILEKFKYDIMKDKVPFEGLCCEPKSDFEQFGCRYDVEINLERLLEFLRDDNIFDNFFSIVSRYNAKEKFVLYLICILIPVNYIIKCGPFTKDGWYCDIEKSVVESFARRVIDLNGENLFFFNNITSEVL